MSAGRLLSPNEAKFWLMDALSPMNSVVVLRARQRLDAKRLAGPSAFRLPSIVCDAQGRPRWGGDAKAGTITEQAATSEDAWLAVAEALTAVRVGTDGHPGWHAVLLHHADTSDLVFAVHHALTDFRTGLWVAHCFLDGADPGPLAPACEDLLPLEQFGDPQAEALIGEWWLARAGARWAAAGLDRLSANLPSPCATRLDLAGLDEAETAAFDAACQREGATPNGVVAAALREVADARRVAHSVDLSRFIRPEPDEGPGLAISHVFTEVPDGEFWEAARAVRADVFEQIAGGAAGDQLLILPRALATGIVDAAQAAAPFTITGAPTVSRRAEAYRAYRMQLVVGSPRAGGGVIILSRDQGRLRLVASSPAGAPPVPVGRVVDRLRRAAAPG